MQRGSTISGALDGARFLSVLQFTSLLVCVNHRNEWSRLVEETTCLKIGNTQSKNGRYLETVLTIFPYIQQCPYRIPDNGHPVSVNTFTDGHLTTSQSNPLHTWTAGKCCLTYFPPSGNSTSFLG